MKKAKELLLKVKNKALVIPAVAVASMPLAVTASAAEAGGAEEDLTMGTVLADAGDQLLASFNTLIHTMIPVIMGILGSALVIFGIFSLIKLAKNIFGKVAG